MQVGAGGAVEEDTARACGRWQCQRTARRRARARPPAGAGALCDNNIKLLLSGSAEGFWFSYV